MVMRGGDTGRGILTMRGGGGILEGEAGKGGIKSLRGSIVAQWVTFRIETALYKYRTVNDGRESSREIKAMSCETG
jgi:hypothetical protein